MVGGFFEVEYQFKLRDMFSSQADKIILKFDAIRDAATRANARFTELSKNIKSSSDNLKGLHAHIAPVNKSLQSMERHSRAVTSSIKAQNMAVAAQTTQIKQAKVAIIDYSRTAGVMMQAGQGFFRTGNILGLTVTAPLVGTLFRSGQVYMGRDDAYAQLRKTAGLKKEDIPLFEALLNRYSSKNPTSAEQMLSIGGILGQGGFKAGNAIQINDLMRRSDTVAKMMIAFDMNEEQAGTTYSRFFKNTQELMNKNKQGRLYGKFNEFYFDRLLDFIDRQENNNVVEASQIFEAMKTRTLASGLMVPGGMDPFESAVFTTQMLGYKSASRGSNIVTQLMKDLANPDKVGKKLSDQFLANPMDTLIEFSEQMKSKTPMEQYRTALQVSKSYAGEFTAVQAGLEEMKRALRVAKKLKLIAEEEARTGVKQNIELTDESGNVFGLDASYEIKKDTFRSKMQTLGNTISNTLSSLFNRLRPTLEKLIDYLVPFFIKLEKSISSMPEKKLVVLVSILTSLALLAPGLMILGAVLNSISAVIKGFEIVKSGILLTTFKNVEKFIIDIYRVSHIFNKKTPPIPPSTTSPPVLSLIKGGAQGGATVTRPVLTVLKGGAEGVKKGGGLLSHIKGVLSGTSKFTGKAISSVAGKLLGKLPVKQQLIGRAIGRGFLPFNIGSTILEGLWTGDWASALAGNAGGLAGGAIGGALGSFAGPIGMFLGATGGGYIGDRIGRAVASFKPLVATLNLIKNIFLDLISPVTRFFDNMLNGISRVVSNSPSLIKMLNRMSETIDKISTYIDNQAKLREEKRDFKSIEHKFRNDLKDEEASRRYSVNKGYSVQSQPTKLEIKVGPDGRPTGVLHRGASTVIKGNKPVLVTLPIMTPLGAQ